MRENDRKRKKGGGRGGDGAPREGRVLSVSVRHAKVACDDDSVVRCGYDPALFQEDSTFTRPVAAGDRVRVEASRYGPTVTAVLPRRGYLSRMRGLREQVIVANLDQVVIVGAAAEPRFRPRLVDRLIVASERARFEPVIVVNKIDRAEDRTSIESLLAIYRGLGYRALTTSAATGEGVEELGRILRGKLSAAAGPSGVGKSTLLNAIEPGLGVKTAPISERWGKGVHTTTNVTLHALAGGGYVADTPGMRAFAVAGLAPAEVGVFFREFQPFIDACRFNSCTHDHEPECAVLAAVAAGRVSAGRHESYIRIIRGVTEEEDGEEGDDEADVEDPAEG